jgi:DNA polymerase (family 10)
MQLPGIGKSIAEKLVELIQTDELAYYEQLKREIPVDLTTLSSIEGVGPKKVKVLYEKLGITNIEELEKASREKKLRALQGLGKRVNRRY